MISGQNKNVAPLGGVNLAVTSITHAPGDGRTFSPTTNLSATKCSVDVCLILHKSGVYNITLEEGRVLVMGEQATNARYMGGKYVNSPQGWWSC